MTPPRVPRPRCARIRKVGRILGIATSVLTLALAAIAGEPQGVLAAVKEVRQAIDADAA